MNLLISLKYFWLKSRISSQREAIDKPLNDISWKIVRPHRNEQKTKKNKKLKSVFFSVKAHRHVSIISYEWFSIYFITSDWIAYSIEFSVFLSNDLCLCESDAFFLSNDMHLCVCDEQNCVCVMKSVNQIELSISDLVFFFNLFVFWPIKNIS